MGYDLAGQAHEEMLDMIDREADGSDSLEVRVSEESVGVIRN